MTPKWKNCLLQTNLFCWKCIDMLRHQINQLSEGEERCKTKKIKYKARIMIKMIYFSVCTTKKCFHLLTLIWDFLICLYLCFLYVWNIPLDQKHVWRKISINLLLIIIMNSMLQYPSLNRITFDICWRDNKTEVILLTDVICMLFWQYLIIIRGWFNSP
jgi:hypothetical protein